jgi:hypothetical protein
LGFLGNERLCLIITASLHCEIDLLHRNLAGVLQIDTVPEFQVNRKRNVVAMDFAVLDWLLELIAAHRAGEFRAIGFQFESDVVGIAIPARLVARPGTGGIGGQQQSRARECGNENASDHARHYMANCKSAQAVGSGWRGGGFFARLSWGAPQPKPDLEL